MHLNLQKDHHLHLCSSRTIQKGEGATSTKPGKTEYEIIVEIWSTSNFLQHLSMRILATSYCRLRACTQAIKAKQLVNYFLSILTDPIPLHLFVHKYLTFIPRLSRWISVHVPPMLSGHLLLTVLTSPRKLNNTFPHCPQ